MDEQINKTKLNYTSALIVKTLYCNMVHLLVYSSILTISAWILIS